MRAFLPLLLLGACDGDVDKGGEDSGSSTDTSTTTDGDTTPADRGPGTITGRVDVQLYTEDDAGDVQEISWDDYGGAFPFGAIFVAAYTVDETTNETTYRDEEVFLAPSVDGDDYTFTVDPDDAEEVYVYAALDWLGDGVIGTSEPMGVYPDLVTIVPDGAVGDVDITIQAPLPDGWAGGGGGDGGGVGEGWITLSGDATITEPYTSGGAKALLYDSAGAGPEYVGAFTPSATEDGGEGTWSMAVPASLGESRLLGAWDSNVNGLIEPTDTWGAYVEGGVSANPLAVGASDTSDLSLLLPYGIPPALVPFVRLEGSLAYEDDFGSLPAGTTVYVTALRVTPGVDFSVDDLERGYDWASFAGADLTGTSLDYVLVAPSSTTAYLWAFADIDGDRILNEVGEPVGNYGRGGRLATGTENQSGLDMHMAYIAE